MAGRYIQLAERGDPSTSGKDMHIRLYPNTPDQDPYCTNDSNKTHLIDAMKSAMDQLYNWGAITYYKLSRFDVSFYNYPDLTQSEGEFDDYYAIKSAFQSYLESENGTGTNLLSAYKGAHTLIHGQGCDTTLASGSNSGDCNDSSSFHTGMMAWTGATCSGDKALAGNSAIQEPLHSFITTLDPDVKPMLGDDDGDSETSIGQYDEHSLGHLDSSADVSPLLTYHWSEFPDKGDCQDQASIKSGYTQTLTWCTKDAVEGTYTKDC